MDSAAAVAVAAPLAVAAAVAELDRARAHRLLCCWCAFPRAVYPGCVKSA